MFAVCYFTAVDAFKEKPEEIVIKKVKIIEFILG